jgi:hypothetical protein
MRNIIACETGAFTLVGWQDTVTTVGGVSQAVAAIADQHVTIAGTDIYVPSLKSLIAEYVARANTLTACQLQSPSLRRSALFDLPVLQQGLSPSGAESFQDHFGSPTDLDVGEKLEAWITDSGTAAVVTTILAWLSDGALKPVNGSMLSVAFSATITAVLGSWVNKAITFSQTLGVGKYDIVGCNVCGAGTTALAFRLVIPGYPWRPGALCTENLGAKPHYEQLYGGMGTWGSFDSATPPTLDLLAASAGSKALVGILNLIKTG